MDSPTPNFTPTLFERLFIHLFHFINTYVPWHRLPSILGAFCTTAMPPPTPKGNSANSLQQKSDSSALETQMAKTILSRCARWDVQA
jgi:hypothetical protein